MNNKNERLSEPNVPKHAEMEDTRSMQALGLGNLYNAARKDGADLPVPHGGTLDMHTNNPDVMVALLNHYAAKVGMELTPAAKEEVVYAAA